MRNYVLSLLVILSLFFGPLSATAVDKNCKGYYEINSGWSNVRNGPGIGHTKIGELVRNQRLLVLSCANNEWREISSKNIPRGYLHKKYLKFIPEGKIQKEVQAAIIKKISLTLYKLGIALEISPKSLYRVNSEWVRLRSGPSTSYQEVDKLYKGQVIEIGHIADSGWAMLNEKYENLYVHSDYLEHLKWAPHKQSHPYLILQALKYIIPEETERSLADVSVKNLYDLTLLPILSYHFVGDVPDSLMDNPERRRNTVSAENFERQLQHLTAREYSTFTFDDLEFLQNEQSLIPTKRAVLTFNGGYRSHYAIAAPLLERYGYRGVFFVNSDYVGNPGYMDWKDLKALRKKGHQIGSYSRNETLLDSLSENLAWNSIKQSRNRIEGNLKARINVIRYPDGAYNADTLNLAKKAGYTFGVGMRESALLKLSEPYELPSRQVFDKSTLTEYLE